MSVLDKFTFVQAAFPNALRAERTPLITLPIAHPQNVGTVATCATPGYAYTAFSPPDKRGVDVLSKSGRCGYGNAIAD